MLKILHDPASPVITTVAIGQLTEEDWRELISALEKQIHQTGKLRWYFEMEDLRGDSIKVQWKNLPFTTQHGHKLERIAIVGNKEWQGWMKAMMEAFHSDQIRYFETQDQQQAHQWIGEGNSRPAVGM
jgi:hypothetical protein